MYLAPISLRPVFSQIPGRSGLECQVHIWTAPDLARWRWSNRIACTHISGLAANCAADTRWCPRC